MLILGAFQAYPALSEVTLDIEGHFRRNFFFEIFLKFFGLLTQAKTCLRELKSPIFGKKIFEKIFENFVRFFWSFFEKNGAQNDFQFLFFAFT